MKQILVEIDDRCAKDLERVAPVRDRKRAEFIRLAIRHAIDLALDRTTDLAYRAAPFEGGDGGLMPGDLDGWDEHNTLAEPARAQKRVGANVSKKRAA